MVEDDRLIRRLNRGDLDALENSLNQTCKTGTAAICGYSNRVTGHYKRKNHAIVKKTCN